MKRLLFSIGLFWQLFLQVSGQVGISTGSITPAPSAILEVRDTTRGVLIPRMTTSQRNAILSPATSLLIYNTTTAAYNFYNGTSWLALSAGNPKLISDTDGNTRVEVEKNANEDKIRFTANGMEIGILDAKCFQLKSPGQSAFIGENSGQNDDGTTNRNVFIGYDAGKSNIVGNSNVYIGAGTGDVSTSSANTFIGAEAGGANTTGSSNTFIGQGAGDVNTVADNNTFVGRDAGGANTSGANNTFIGQGAGVANTTASDNLFIGNSAGAANVIGSRNTFIGVRAGDVNTTNNNTFIGTDAGGSNTTGTSNTFIGQNAGDVNVAASNNTFIGVDAGGSNTSGQFNTSIGARAGDMNTTANNNTFLGADAGGANTTGTGNTFVGQNAGLLNVIGTSNTFVGQGAGDANASHSNTFVGKDAGGSNTFGTQNVFVGESAGRSNLISNENVFVGQNAGVSAIGGQNTFVGSNSGAGTIEGTDNTFVGQVAGELNTSGSGNVLVGIRAGNTNITGTNNTCIGKDSDVSTTGLINSTALGDSAVVTASNKIRLGNEDITLIEGQVSWSFPSDARFKYDINDAHVPGLDMITRLHPVNYRFDTDLFKKHISGEKTDYTAGAFLQNANQPMQTGFLAQEVEQVCDEINFKFSGLHIPENNTDNYSIAYGSFVPLLVKAVQEQQAQIEEQRNQLHEYETRMQALEQAMSELIHQVEALQVKAEK